MFKFLRNLFKPSLKVSGELVDVLKSSVNLEVIECDGEMNITNTALDHYITRTYFSLILKSKSKASEDKDKREAINRLMDTEQLSLIFPDTQERVLATIADAIRARLSVKSGYELYC